MKPAIKTSPRITMLGLIGITAATQTTSAAIISTVNGNLTVSSANNGANRIVANGGADPVVTILNGTILSADGANPGILLNSADYYNASASGLFGPASGNSRPELLDGGDIVIPSAGLINNDGSITGGTHGLNANNRQVTLINSGTLTGNSGSGVFNLTSGSFVANSGTITGNGNNNSGIRGISADDVTVHNTGTITSGTGQGVGVILDDDALVINSGTITGSARGVALGSGGVLYNLEGGLIEGDIGFGNNINILQAGINTQLTLYNWGTITGFDGTAVQGTAGDDSFYINPGSSINGDIEAGLFGEDFVDIHSDFTGVVSVDGSVQTGVESDIISLHANAENLTEDPVTFENGSISISGNVNGGQGDDEITLEADMAGAIDIAGSILGGETLILPGNDSINLHAASLGSINVDGDIDGGISDDSILLESLDSGSITIGGGVFGGDSALFSGSDTFSFSSGSGGGINITGAVDGGAGTDTANLEVFGEGTIFVGGGILAETIDLLAESDGSITVQGGIAGGADDSALVMLSATGGLISVEGGIATADEQDEVTLSSSAGGLVKVLGGIDTGDAGDTITLTTFDGTDSNGSIVVVGGVEGGAGDQTLTLNGGLVTMLDFSGDSGFDDFVGSMRGTGANLIIGNVNQIQNINKTGTGMAMIAGYDEGSGQFNSGVVHAIDTINITNGSLYINGGLGHTLSENRTAITAGFDPGSIENESDNTFARELGGTGAWNADVLMQSGGISAGQTAMNLDWDLSDTSGPVVNPIGTLDLTGSITFNPDTFIRYDLNPQIDTALPVSGGVDADLIVHSTAGGGVVTFDAQSSVRFSPSNINRVVSDGRYVIVSSNAGIVGAPSSDLGIQFNANVPESGQFSGTLVPQLTGTQTANVDGTNLASFTTLAVEANGGGGDDLVAIVQHDYQGLGQTPNQAALGAAIDALIYSTDTTIQDFIAALDYSDAATAVAAFDALSPENHLNQTVAAMDSNYRTHRMLANHLAAARNSGGGQIVRQQVSFGGSISRTMSGRGGPWGNLSYDLQDYEDNGMDYDGITSAFTAGFDWRVTPSLLLGVLMDGSTGDYDYIGGDSEIDSVRFAAYGTWGETRGFYTDFAIGYGIHAMSDERTVGGIFPGTIGSSTDADSLQTLWTVGHIFVNGPVKHGPYAGFEYQNMKVDGFNVSGGILPIAVDGYDVQSMRGLIGYRAETSCGKFSPYASIAYAHEFKEENVITNAAIAGSPFSVTTDGIGSAVLLALGSGYVISESLSMNFGYNGEISVESEGVDSHGIYLGLDLSF